MSEIGLKLERVAAHQQTSDDCIRFQRLIFGVLLLGGLGLSLWPG